MKHFINLSNKFVYDKKNHQEKLFVVLSSCNLKYNRTKIIYLWLKSILIIRE